MSWRCGNCETINPDSNSECYVCGAVREAILYTDRTKMKEPIERVRTAPMASMEEGRKRGDDVRLIRMREDASKVKQERIITAISVVILLIVFIFTAMVSSS